MIKRLIFDIDGTLIRNVNFDKQVENTLKKLGIFTNENKAKFIEAMLTYEDYYTSYDRTNYTNHIAKNIGIELDERFLQIYFEELKTAIPKSNVKLKETLTKLSLYFELVLLSNYFKESQINRLASMGISKLFTNFYGETLNKPNPKIFLESIGSYKREECVMIGDNLDLDIKPANELGINTILVNSKGYEVKDLQIVVVNSVEDITPDLINLVEQKRKLIKK